MSCSSVSPQDSKRITVNPVDDRDDDMGDGLGDGDLQSEEGISERDGEGGEEDD